MLWLIGIPIPHHHSSLFFTPSEASHEGLDLERKRRGPAAQTAASMVRQSMRLSFFWNRTALALPEPGIFVISHRPDKLAGRRGMPPDLNFPKDVQIFDMAFAERLSMVSITRRAVS
ncbi:hypothetical protein HFO90_05145 [Rhizobium leguminosarum]|nr:hypothetical protein [Rhizobium leguminosarum]